MAESTKAMIMLELANSPLGMGPGEGNLQAPFNSAMPKSRVFLINHSATQKRKFVKVGVSGQRGAEEALRADAELRKVFNVATLRDEAAKGKDVNLYGEKIAPVLFAPMWNGKRYPIPPARSEDEAPPAVQVPEGLWDLLMGNYERMNHPDPRERAEEAMRLAVSQTQKHSPILFVTIDGERANRTNPFGFIEIERRTEKMEPVQADSEFLTALELVEG